MDLRQAIKQIDAHLKWAGKDSVAENQVDLHDILDWLKELKALRRLAHLEEQESKKSGGFSDEEKELLALSLAMRRNYIETGDPVLGAADAAKMNQDKVRALSPDQMRTILQTRDLEHKIWNMGEDALKEL